MHSHSLLIVYLLVGSSRGFVWNRQRIPVADTTSVPSASVSIKISQATRDFDQFHRVNIALTLAECGIAHLEEAPLGGEATGTNALCIRTRYRTDVMSLSLPPSTDETILLNKAERLKIIPESFSNATSVDVFSLRILAGMPRAARRRAVVKLGGWIAYEEEEAKCRGFVCQNMPPNPPRPSLSDAETEEARVNQAVVDRWLQKHVPEMALGAAAAERRDDSLEDRSAIISYIVWSSYPHLVKVLEQGVGGGGPGLTASEIARVSDVKTMPGMFQGDDDIVVREFYKDEIEALLRARGSNDIDGGRSEDEVNYRGNSGSRAGITCSLLMVSLLAVLAAGLI